MANRPNYIFLILLLVISFTSFARQALADDRVEVIKTDIERKEVRFDRIDTENFEVSFPTVGLIAIEDFKSSVILGGRLAFHLNEYLFIEASAGIAEGDKTSFEELNPGTTLVTDDDREYFSWDVSLGFNVFPGEAWLFGSAHSSDFYFIAGAGKTEFGGKKHSTINIGVGYRFYFNDWMTLRLDIRDHIFNRNVFTEDNTTHNIELSTGLSFFF